MKGLHSACVCCVQRYPATIAARLSISVLQRTECNEARYEPAVSVTRCCAPLRSIEGLATRWVAPGPRIPQYVSNRAARVKGFIQGLCYAQTAYSLEPLS